MLAKLMNFENNQIKGSLLSLKSQASSGFWECVESHPPPWHDNFLLMCEHCAHTWLMADTCQKCGALAELHERDGHSVCVVYSSHTLLLLWFLEIKCKRFGSSGYSMFLLSAVTGVSVFFSWVLLFSLLTCCIQYRIVCRKMEAIFFYLSASP